jgi:hypothetical protein
MPAQRLSVPVMNSYKDGAGVIFRCGNGCALASGMKIVLSS